MAFTSKMVRRDFQQLARQRLREAKLLLDEGCSLGAYYLAGYAVECALKACIAKKTRRHEFPDKDFAIECYKHGLNELLGTAGLSSQLTSDGKTQPRLSSNWAWVKDWKVDSRYSLTIDQRTAEQLYKAIVGRPGGVMKWLRKHFLITEHDFRKWCCHPAPGLHGYQSPPC
jgi:hypothetical protein